MRALLIGTMGLALIGAQASAVMAQDSAATTGATATTPASGPSETGVLPPDGTTGSAAAPAQPVAQATPQQPTGSASEQPTGAASETPAAAGTPSETAAGTAVATDPAADPNAPAEVAAWEGPVPTSYLGAAPQMLPNELTAWLANPRSVLDENLEGGGEMVRFVRSLIGSDSGSVLPLVDLTKLPDVNDKQTEAIAIGFASGVRESETPAPEYAAYLQWAVAQSESPKFIDAFERASGADEEATAALGARGGTGSSPGAGSLAGTGEIGPSGPVQAVSEGVVQEDGDNVFSLSGNTLVCNNDVSPAGCVLSN